MVHPVMKHGILHIQCLIAEQIIIQGEEWIREKKRRIEDSVRGECSSTLSFFHSYKYEEIWYIHMNIQRFQFKKEKSFDLVFVVIKNIYEVSNSFFYI